MFYFAQNIIYFVFLFLHWNINFRNNAPKLQYPPQCFVTVNTVHHASSHCLHKIFVLIVGNKNWPTPAGWRLIFSQQCWSLASDLSSLPSMPILRHSVSGRSQIHVVHHRAVNKCRSSRLHMSVIKCVLLSLTGCTVLKYIPLPDDEQQRIYRIYTFHRWWAVEKWSWCPVFERL